MKLNLFRIQESVNTHGINSASKDKKSKLYDQENP